MFSPFAGVGSEGVGAIRQGRKFVGVELKPEYFQRQVENLYDAVAAHKHARQPTLLDALEEVEA